MQDTDELLSCIPGNKYKLYEYICVHFQKDMVQICTSIFVFIFKKIWYKFESETRLTQTYKHHCE